MRNVRPYEAPFRKRPKKVKAGHSTEHESAVKHVTGAALYIDDIPEPKGLIHLATVGSQYPHAKILSINTDALKDDPSVIGIYRAADVPGELDVGPVYPGDPLLAEEVVEFVGQPILAIAAKTFEDAQRATQRVQIDYEVLDPVLSVTEAVEQDIKVLPTHTMETGDVEQALNQAPHKVSAEVYIRGQEHLYLEGQVAMAIPQEDGGMHVYTSSQHPTEVQKLVAEVLGIPLHLVTAEVRRMGGGFGGKESQAAAVACIAAIVANKMGQPAKYRVPRRQDMEATGKRHDFLARSTVGFNDQGVIEGADIFLAGKCGYSPDLSEGIVDRAMFHADNAYFLNNARVVGHRSKTHTVSNTAFRGFGGPQGMVTIENMIELVARQLGEDPLTIRKRNLYRPGYDVTHYGQKIEQHQLPEIIEKLEEDCEYWERREAIKRFNQTHKTLKKGLALTPVKFGISFTAIHLNQAGALLHVYTDGSVMISHAGTEMGQGLYTKIQQLVASELGVDIDWVKVSSTRTDKVPNTSPTAASSGTDLNGMAAVDAARTIKLRLIEFLTQHYGVSDSEIHFAGSEVNVADQTFRFSEVCRLAYMNRIQLSATGFYKTPKIHYDRESGKGHPFFYFANGAAASEVTIDTLTGEYRVTRTDILHDVGRSINPSIDIGQIEGGFVQGMGWLTTEELLWDDNGRVISNGPATYKIPTAFDIPPVFNVSLHEGANKEASVFNSKAVGEPPLMLAISVWSALQDACAAVADYKISPLQQAPATPEQVFNAVKKAEVYMSENRCANP